MKNHFGQKRWKKTFLQKMLKKPFCGFMLEGSFGHIEKRENLGKERLKGVGVYCSKFDCSTINWSTLLAGNQLLDTKCINCLNPVNPGSTRFEQWTLLSSVCMTSVADLVMRGWNRPNLPGLYQKFYPGSGGVTVGNQYTQTKD
jgi:hypothetical protein